MADTILGMELSFLDSAGARHTAREINHQPEIWKKTFELVKDRKTYLEAFLSQCFSYDSLDIIFTGAGTSAFIGDSLESIFRKNTNRPCRAIPTTQIVTHPNFYLSKNQPTLLVSFARSGDSPESLAVVNLADQFCDTIFHLIITCNADGGLARYATKPNTFSLILPPETNDRSLAMTSSYTGMLLAGILLSKLPMLNAVGASIDLLCRYGLHILKEFSILLKSACQHEFDRAVFLGSGPMIGCAEECQLKLQELTDGTVICKHDSFLGFRHGPKAIITDNTLMVYFFCRDPYVQQYEQDLLRDVNSGKRGIYSIGVMEHDIPSAKVDLKVILSESGMDESIDPDFLVVCNTIVGQLLGFFRSLRLGFEPDTPSRSGTITRVVQGVKIYPYK